MKTRITTYLALLLSLTASFASTAGELTASAIQGKWMFTHIVMDGSQEMKVNNPTEFLPDGTAIFYSSSGNERDRGTYQVSVDAIVYTDKKGKQVWKLVSLKDGKLHVDHKGAEMYFERQ